MPLLHRKPFVRQRPPPDLDPDEEVFLCKITHEIFRSYDEFFERTILCNSLVWSCALTGRAGLTYLEAVESERRARSSLQSFPEVLLRPLLLMVEHSQSRRLSELCEEVYGFTKDRFFPGETVDVTVRGGHRMLCRVAQVISPQSSANGLMLSPVSKANGSVLKAEKIEGDSIVISDSDEETPPPQMNGKRRKPLSPSAFRYTVRPDDEEKEAFTTKAAQLSRRKNVLSRERLKLLFKQHCEPHNGAIVLKAASVSRYGLADLSFSQFFPDDPPLFSPASKASPAQGALSHLKAMEEKLKLLQKKEEMSHHKTQKKKDDKERVKEEKRKRREREEKRRQREEKLRQREESEHDLELDRTKLKEDREKIREELRQRRRQEKEMKRAEKEKEREKLKEEKKKFAERMKQMSKRREDLECEDLQELPEPLPVQTRLPSPLFGEALMVLEFLRAFGEIFELKDEFPDGLTLDVLEEALVGSDPEGPLCELLFFFLSAIFQSSDEEQEQSPDQEPDQSEAVDDAADSASTALATVTTVAGAWSQLHQGRSLRRLDLDSCTLSEILRLLLLSANEKDDPCTELRDHTPHILHRLRTTAVYDLTPEEKLQILNALVGKLLTLGLSRDLIEDGLEEHKAARQELREIRAEQHRREREEAAYRVRMRREERLREQELKLKEREDKLREQENISLNGTAPQPPPELKTHKDVGKVPDSRPEALSPEELQKEQEKVRELLLRLHRASSCTALQPLGRDRWFRKYWLLPSHCALFVEEDAFGLTADMIRPQGGAAEPLCNGSSQDLEEADAHSSASSPGPLPRPPHSAPRWWFFSSVEQLEQLLQSLDSRGNRENGLKEALRQEKDRITAALQSCEENKYRHTEEQRFPECTAAESVMEARLRDLLLDIEDRVYQGTLGYLKHTERQVWRAALETGDYNALTDSCEDQSETAWDSLGASSLGSSSVRALASALAQIERGMERRFLKPPLGEDESKRDKAKKKSRREEDQASDDGSEGRTGKTVLERWRESLSGCTSLSQVFVHLSSLERSILWARSVLNARCRICRRKGDADNMLLCDGCDRGHHTHCLRPKLKSVPVGDWFCPDCRPKQRSSRVSSRARSEEEEEEEEDDDSERTVDSEEERSEEEESEEEAPPPSKKTSAPPPRGKSQSASSRSQQTTPKNSGSAAKPAPRSGGKKPSPPVGKAPPRAGSRSSARLSHESPASSSSKTTPKTSPQPRPKPPSSGPAPSRQPRPVLSSGPVPSSGSRRSSGRNHGVHELSVCETLTVELTRHEDSWPFVKLVSRTQVPDYYDIIQKPIALSTIREKVNNCEYTCAADFVADVQLMFANCLEYNPRHSNEAKAGLRLQQFFLSELHHLGLDLSENQAEPPAKRTRT